MQSTSGIGLSVCVYVRVCVCCESATIAPAEYQRLLSACMLVSVCMHVCVYLCACV